MGTGTAAARGSAPLSPTPAPPVTRSTPSVELTETGARALCRNLEIRELHPAQEPQLRSLERSQGRSQERSQERSQARNQERSQERNPGRSQEKSQEKERSQTKAIFQHQTRFST